MLSTLPTPRRGLRAAFTLLEIMIALAILGLLVVLAVVRVSESKEENAKSHLETWTFDTGANRWTKLNPPREPDPSGSRARNLVFAPDINAFLLENRTHPPSGPSGTADVLGPEGGSHA